MDMQIGKIEQISPYSERGVELLRRINSAGIEQPDDPFDGLGDFEYSSESFEMMQLREAERIWRDKALAAESCLHQALHVLDRPLKHYKKADLLRLIGIAQDTLLAFEQRLFRAGRVE